MRLLRRKPPPLVCREFVELVTDYLEDRLPARERARFEAHLAECDGCEGYLEDMRRMIATMGTVTAPSDPHTREALMRAVRDLRGGS
ncbi:MAG TPA: zf-HC2 domain-containing protein [Solirubrobacteraceae bacterium]|nr:zf-HC2 domain-containing protein [Solirubrobacteraceae bacterium]